MQRVQEEAQSRLEDLTVAAVIDSAVAVVVVENHANVAEPRATRATRSIATEESNALFLNFVFVMRIPP